MFLLTEQSMCITMTFETFSELGMDNPGMGQTMTVLAFRYAGVTSLVAVHAIDAAVEAL